MSADWFTADECRVEDLAEICAGPTPRDEYPGATAIEQRAVVYDAAALRERTARLCGHAVMGELAHALGEGPGVIAVRGAFDPGVIDRATEVFVEMIADQHAAGVDAGDHYAKPGANDRIWNALEKLALRAPDVFVDYYANDMVALGARAWLGPGYQIASQINVVNPGGEAQMPHRDYHLGFFTDDQAEHFAPHIHRLSPALTLQGGVAHSDMPIESGPTMLLPHSQKYGPGFLAWRRDDVKAYFAQHCIQLPLAKGDIVFFNPAVLHAAGTNHTPDVRRMANLLQISSPFGRAMETIDRDAMALTIYPVLLARSEAGTNDEALQRAIDAAAEGYAFPTNLDRDPPIGGLAPDAEAVTLRHALDERWSLDRLESALAAHAERRRT